MLRRGFSEVFYLSRFVLLFLYSSHTNILLCTTRQTYSNIFISPSSSESFDDEDENGAARKQQRTTNSQRKATKCNVANILGMDGRVTPRSIAYAAVLVRQPTNIVFIKISHHCLQLAFNLTDAGYWMEVYNNFNFRALYALIVDFFEGASGQAARRRSQNLLKWWSTYVYSSIFWPIEID